MHLSGVTIHHERYPTRDRYPFNIKTLQETAALSLDAPVCFFIGENGTGKSTLLEALCRRCGIFIWEGMDRVRYEVNPYEKAFQRVIDVHWTNGAVPGSYFGSDIFRNFAQLLDEWASSDPGLLRYFGGKSLMTQSHGQSLMSFFRARYEVSGLYFLDEPETALSPRSQLDFVRLLGKMKAAGHAQFIIATHSPILMACPGGKIYSFDAVPVREISYEETEHYRIYKDFMEDRSRFFS
jgi:predicted ATPase